MTLLLVVTVDNNKKNNNKNLQQNLLYEYSRYNIMPRQSRKGSSAAAEHASKAEKKSTATATATAAATPSGNSNKRSIRWFVHPPSFLFTNHNNNNKSPTNHKNDKDYREEESLPESSLLSTTPRPPKGGGVAATNKEGGVQVLHQLQRELEEAKEQILALEKIKELQAEEMKRLRTTTTPATTTSTSTTTNIDVVDTFFDATNNPKGRRPRVHGDDADDVVDDDDDVSSTCSIDGSSLEDDTAVARLAARGATSDLMEETNHPITLTTTLDDPTQQGEPALLAEPTGGGGDGDGDVGGSTTRSEGELVGQGDSTSREIVIGEDDDDMANDSLDNTFERSADRPMTPNSMTGPASFWQALAFENAVGIDDENDMDQLPSVLPPIEVTAIHDPSSPLKATNMMSRNPAQLLAIRLRDAEQRASAYRQKLETSQDLVASLFRDLERARRTIQSLVTRNLSLSRNVKNLKVQQEDNMIQRNSLVKACVYITPVFVLCGGLEFFLSTVLLVWILVELEVSWFLGDDEDDDDNEDDVTNEEDALLKLQEKDFPAPLAKDMPIPSSIVLSSVEQAELDNSTTNQEG